MIIQEFSNVSNFIPAIHVLFACVKRSELCTKFRTALEGAIAAALNSPIYWSKLNEEKLSPTLSAILPAVSPHRLLLIGFNI